MTSADSTERALRPADSLSASADRTRASLLLRLGDRTDRVSWQEFHALYGRLLYRYARCRGANQLDAEDIAQEVEAQFLRALDGFQYDPDKGRFRAYLRTAVVHALSRRRRTDSRQPRPIDPRTFDGIAEPDETWEREWRLHEVRLVVRSVVGEVDDMTRRAFELHILESCPASETAQRLNISIWRVYRARDRMLSLVRDQLCRREPDLFPAPDGHPVSPTTTTRPSSPDSPA